MVRIRKQGSRAWLRGPCAVLLLAGVPASSACSGDDDDGGDGGDGSDGSDRDGTGGGSAMCDADSGSITLPDGFCASVFADDLGAARHLTVNASGDVFVAVADAFDGSAAGEVVALRDTDGDGVADESSASATAEATASPGATTSCSSPSTIDQVEDDGVRFAEGLRNMVALAVHPDSGALFGVQNGRDQLFDSWPDLFAPEDELELPSEALFLSDGELPYGWP